MKKILSSVLATVLVAGSLSVGAVASSASYDGTIQVADGTVVDGSGNAYGDVTISDGKLSIDGVTPSSTIYIKLDDVTLSGSNAESHDPAQLANDTLYSFNAKKETNSKLVKDIDVVSEKNIGSFVDRPNWLKIVLNDSTMTSEQKFEGKVTFKAKRSSTEENMNKYTNAGVVAGDTFTLNISMWINNKAVGNDDNPGAGDRFYFDPDDNEENTLIWGDDRAALKFDATNDANKFYARLSTKANADIYSNYADPVGAELWFYDFVGHPVIPSTARATLTLGIPWDLDSDLAPNPSDCFIYELDSDGNLTDVTDQFTYSIDDQDIEGWSIKTRSLGTYIISDTELDLDEVPEESSSSSSASKPSSNSDKVIPNTGASDMVGVAAVMAVVSLAAAGAIAFRKASK